jgi:hypothetical protein
MRALTKIIRWDNIGDKLLFISSESLGRHRAARLGSAAGCFNFIKIRDLLRADQEKRIGSTAIFASLTVPLKKVGSRG